MLRIAISTCSKFHAVCVFSVNNIASVWICFVCVVFLLLFFCFRRWRCFCAIASQFCFPFGLIFLIHTYPMLISAYSVGFGTCFAHSSTHTKPMSLISLSISSSLSVHTLNHAIFHSVSFEFLCKFTRAMRSHTHKYIHLNCVHSSLLL